MTSEPPEEAEPTEGTDPRTRTDSRTESSSSEGSGPAPGPSRRRFLRAARRAGEALTGASLLLGAHRAAARQARPSVAPAGQAPLRPPGAAPGREFVARCIGCALCGEVCPPACIEFPASVEGADVGLRRPRTGPLRAEPAAPRWRGGMTPWVLPWLRGCTLCMACTQVCPTGALAPLDEGAVRMGRAVVDEKVCLPFNRISWCGACYTACPLKERAIRVDHRNRPEVLDGCVGCGLCVEACPLRYKAIAVRPPFAPDEGEVRAE